MKWPKKEIWPKTVVGREEDTGYAHNSKQYPIMDKHFSCCALWRCVVACSLRMFVKKWWPTLGFAGKYVVFFRLYSWCWLSPRHRETKTKQSTKTVYACRVCEAESTWERFAHTNIYNFLCFSFFHFYARGAINFPSINFHFLFSAVYPRIIFCASISPSSPSSHSQHFAVIQFEFFRLTSVKVRRTYRCHSSGSIGRWYVGVCAQHWWKRTINKNKKPAR